MLTWYVENAVVRFSKTNDAVTFIRPMLEACIVGANLAGQIAGKSLVRLRALKRESNVLSADRSLLVTPGSREEAADVLKQWLERNAQNSIKIHDPYFGPDALFWLQMIRTAKPSAEIFVLTASKNQPKLNPGEDLADLYSSNWSREFDQTPPIVKISVIGGEFSKASPIHDRWLVSGSSGLRFGASFNSLGLSKESEISEMSPDEAEQVNSLLDQYLSCEKMEHNGERLRLLSFML